MRLIRGAGLVAAGVCAGMVTEYLLDPERGKARRTRMRDRTTHRAHDVNDGLHGLSHDISNRGRGMAMAARYRITGRSADDAVLHDRVRAELGRLVSHPHAIQVRVDGRSVTLIGDVLADEEKLARHAIKRIPGVQKVDAQWTVHEEAGNVPTLQGKGHLHAGAKRPHP
jgi:osmotically-inducible protein OsmY